MTAMITVSGLSKTYVLHNQGGVRLPVLRDAALTATAGQCLALHGPSGSGKSTLLRCLYGNCKADSGMIRVRHGEEEVELVSADPRRILDVRKRTIGYVSQFLRAIPRVTALDVVAEPLRPLGVAVEQARDRAATLLERLRIPERLWGLPPATFSGGEQQRVNIARGFVAAMPILLLDEPTASLDALNRQTVIALIDEAKQRGATMVGVFHDDEVREAVADSVLTMRSEVAA
jgi:alpha-D-ribose 1-methylphosphonate 5-triphosphate synthase subunit PhnL